MGYGLNWEIQGNSPTDRPTLMNRDAFEVLNVVVLLGRGKIKQILLSKLLWIKKQCRIHGMTVADGWAGGVMQKTLEFHTYLGHTDLPTDRHSKVLSCVSATRNDDRSKEGKLFCLVCNK